ncbi:CLUMA_CG000471, isoform A [Clunio marinus]|uniref:CLUMA_CG000471, isoform A n=1 Tax=Clunio marinus TaxID=568069 RepID=A0A1J1HFK9_9DIPT|nr:CLUMA_CG000471, isoform A [Clunio marinus]
MKTCLMSSFFKSHKHRRLSGTIIQFIKQEIFVTITTNKYKIKNYLSEVMKSAVEILANTKHNNSSLHIINLKDTANEDMRFATVDLKIEILLPMYEME